LNYTCYACAIMPDHVHLLIRKHKNLSEEMIEKIQALGRRRPLAA
jgi:REP element-mobilizing transposase RayT